MIDLTRIFTQDRREETAEEADAAMLHATVESAYMLGCTPEEVHKHISKDPELFAIKNRLKDRVYEASDEEDHEISFF
ncbi:hypothetical protein KY338_00080 [Candidatus Woesearchaeota archaeon]|nr:hypothetical protein [Candidatus Woesearchaeota archaeon]MBW3005281.1 hypothetical protein [Candidatus Woesearchaeota archaeon]